MSSHVLEAPLRGGVAAPVVDGGQQFPLGVKRIKKLVNGLRPKWVLGVSSTLPKIIFRPFKVLLGAERTLHLYEANEDVLVGCLQPNRQSAR